MTAIPCENCGFVGCEPVLYCSERSQHVILPHFDQAVLTHFLANWGHPKLCPTPFFKI